MKRIFFFVVFLLVVLVGLTFSLKNPQVVEVSYYFGLNWQGSLAVVVLLALAVGVLLGFLGSLSMVIQARRELARRRKELRSKEQEIVNLRSLPIKDEI